jgi:hypothetical protein
MFAQYIPKLLHPAAALQPRRLVHAPYAFAGHKTGLACYLTRTSPEPTEFASGLDRRLREFRDSLGGIGQPATRYFRFTRKKMKQGELAHTKSSPGRLTSRCLIINHEGD